MDCKNKDIAIICRLIFSTDAVNSYPKMGQVKISINIFNKSTLFCVRILRV